jgi:hypothetical protein
VSLTSEDLPFEDSVCADVHRPSPRRPAHQDVTQLAARNAKASMRKLLLKGPEQRLRADPLVQPRE